MMKKEMDIEQVSNTTQSPLVGDVLRQKRESLGMSVDDISRKLRLKSAVIEEIERNEFDSTKSITFIRGYCRSYAKAVGIEEEVVLGLLNDTGSTTPSEQKLYNFSNQQVTRKHNRRISSLTFVILIVIVGVPLVLWWQSQTRDNDLMENFAETSSYPESTESRDTTNDESLIDTNRIQAQTELSNSEKITALNANDANDLNDQVAPNAVSTDDNDATGSNDQAIANVKTTDTTIKTDNVAIDAKALANTIQLVFSEDCWVQVKDANNKILVSGTKKKGETFTSEGKAPYSFILGVPTAVTLTIAGKKQDLTQYTGGKVARFSLP